jgi:uncharacterized protein YbaR (Trm112 family)
LSLIDPTLAEVLVCTVDKADLIEDSEAEYLECTECGRRYPVQDGVPNMLVDQAEEGPEPS